MEEDGLLPVLLDELVYIADNGPDALAHLERMVEAKRAYPRINVDRWRLASRIPVLSCAPGTTRTCDLGIRRPLLYPPELRRQCAGQSIQLWAPPRLADATRAKSIARLTKSVIVWKLDTRTTSAGKRLLTATRRVH
jgi:hypothetical protein